MEEAAPETGFQKFKKSKIALPIGLIIALLVSIGLFYGGLFVGLCGMGFLLIGILLFMIPKVFGAKDLKIMLAFGLVFFLVVSAIGAFAVSQPTINGNSDYASYNDKGFTDVDFLYSEASGTITASVKYTEGANVTFNFGELGFICYNVHNSLKIDNTKNKMTESATEPGSYSITLDASSGKVYMYSFTDTTAGGSTTSVTKFYTGAANGQLTMITMIGNMYYVGLTALMYYMIVIFTTWTSKNLEKTRAKMEAEGRLYPQGYGRCKECQSLVLPGETCCRKCGAYIDVPDEIKVKKVDFFECSECGAEVPSDANVCPKCGAKFDEEEEIVVKENKE